MLYVNILVNITFEIKSSWILFKFWRLFATFGTNFRTHDEAASTFLDPYNFEKRFRTKNRWETVSPYKLCTLTMEIPTPLCSPLRFQFVFASFRCFCLLFAAVKSFHSGFLRSHCNCFRFIDHLFSNFNLAKPKITDFMNYLKKRANIVKLDNFWNSSRYFFIHAWPGT